MNNQELLDLLFSAKKEIESREGKNYSHASGYLSECIKWVNTKKEFLSLEEKIRKETEGFNKFFHATILTNRGGCRGGFVTVDNYVYSMIQYKDKVRVWDKPVDFLHCFNQDKDYILEIDVFKS